ncbi:isochorismatase hydrolase [Neoasaia chiangmaiensis NBRC 101099]|uniref:Hydrolase n=1 Tax=Neoasaia chiangmaiensis TaxID=320497 RepID=A0A1U9KV24_9PROT|nr:isochorismatase family protein [Neoasaia chiangmaiensis]AQS89599.1 hydrolase [Neoasaia chiangmaiensis]GBR36976.1 isochorismatase hydrolase [Neoasaia chiangmaiensis NBRC 101099]GEN16571.1 hydrolase [Neoasaia chiangmaiensis]
MPVTVLDKIPALIIVDLQKGLAGLPTAHPFGSVVDNSRRLAEAFRKKGLPVVLVNVAGGAPGRADVHQNQPSGASAARPADWAELLEELDRQPDDILVTKNTWGAFQGTDLAEALAARHVTQVVITGVATSIGVESTARSAHEHGLHVVLATDAMTDTNAAAHEHSTSRIFPRLGETATTDEILAKLAAHA